MARLVFILGNISQLSLPLEQRMDLGQT